MLIADCEICRSNLSPYLEGELGSSERESLETHLATCGSCSAELSALKGMLATLKEFPAPVVPGDFRKSVWERIDAPTVRERLRRRLLEPWYLKIPAEALVATAVAFLMIHLFHPAEVPTPKAGQAAMDALAQAPASPPQRNQGLLKPVPVSSMMSYEKMMAVAEATPPPGVPVRIVVHLKDPFQPSEEFISALQGFQSLESDHPSSNQYRFLLPEEEYPRFIEAFLALGRLEISVLESPPEDFPRVMRERQRPSGAPARVVILGFVYSPESSAE